MALGIQHSRSALKTRSWIRPAALADPGNRGLPVGTWLFATLLLAAMVLQIVASYLGFQAIVLDLGLRSNLWSWTDPAGYSPIVTYAFLHSGTQHFAFNAFMVLLVGSVIEWRLGRRAILALIVLGAIGAGLSHLILFPAEARPLIGASGIVAALFGAAAVVAGGIGFRVRAPFSELWLSLTLRRVLVAWFGLQLFGLSTVYFFSEAPISVAYWAHLAGFAVGVAAGLLSIQLGMTRSQPVLNPALSTAGD